ncbi:3'-5' exonuclease [Campylobacter geochelonis]|uniref:Polysaccharide biosynthesis protein n=1 Tax=Campylobacter geochelonis TaxID=1780362 RepID=A0A128EQI2_9BACT|nr:3'-5' exonuclease [Campylobacter geochelonis]QKF71863.1 putative polysaccharide biosynthesis protein [Campylobacter geochelonis]CZE47038.1 polysaccharide biosynthesis protein [Campylobacter geochelonis]CZE47382.1 polysaccharide biosynthesis protein [Campylobacter geochelonis]CZE50969.1 polysaccharide biosynthesis protein [Campylobacter geochelonis]
MIKQELICVFDCETVPDTQSLLRVLEKEVVDSCYESSDTSEEKVLNHKKLSYKAMEVFKEKNGSDFLPVCFHQVVSISAVMADKFGKFLRVNTIEGENEEQIITKFLKFINSHQPRLISFNGRGFDLPMLMVRAMRYNISAPAYFEVENREFNKNKWENYRSRYDGRFHLDLLDHISEFRAVSGLKLDNLCCALNLPGKYEVEGSQVLELFYDKKQDKIDEYCQSDTLNTYWLFLKYELLRGNLTLEDYASYLDAMSEYLLKERFGMSYTPIFTQFIKDELKRV